MAQRGNGFQCHVASSLNRPFVVLFQKDRAHEAEDGGFIGKDPHDIRSPLDLSIETFDRIGGVDLRPVVFREGGVRVSDRRTAQRKANDLKDAAKALDLRGYKHRHWEDVVMA